MILLFLGHLLQPSGLGFYHEKTRDECMWMSSGKTRDECMWMWNRNGKHTKIGITGTMGSGCHRPLFLFCTSSTLALRLHLLSLPCIYHSRCSARSRYNIPGSWFEDCMLSVFCSCCTLLQSYRHMKRSREIPFKGCDSRIVGAIQV